MKEICYNNEIKAMHWSESQDIIYISVLSFECENVKKCLIVFCHFRSGHAKIGQVKNRSRSTQVRSRHFVSSQIRLLGISGRILINDR